MLLRPCEDQSIEHLHGFDDNQPESAPDGLKQLPLGSPLLADLAVQGATELLELVNQKGEHHDGKEGQAQILLAEAKVVLEVISLILEGVEGFVFDFPAGAPAPHDVVDIVLGQGEVGNPTEVLGLLAVILPVFQDVDEEVFVGFIERETVGEPEEVVHTRIFWIREVVLDGLSRLHGGVQATKEVFVIVFFDAEDEVAPCVQDVTDVGSIGAESVFGDDGSKMRVIFSELREPPSGPIAFAVILGFTVLLADRFWSQGDDGLRVGMDDGCAECLKVVNRLARLGA